MRESPSVWFRLAPGRDACGVSCGEDGVFVGPVPLLIKKADALGNRVWALRPMEELNASLTLWYGMPIDLSGKRDALGAIAAALNLGRTALACIATVQMQLPDLPHFEKRATCEEELDELVFLLYRSGILKGDWEPTQHPRWSSGAPDSQGGEFRPADDGGISVERDGISPIQQAQMSPDCLEEWLRAQEYCGWLQSSGRLGVGDYRNFGRSYGQCIRGMVSARCGGNPIG